MNDEMITLLEAGLRELGLPENRSVAEKLTCYVEMIEKANTYHSFVSASGNDLITRHILDSLAPWKIFRKLLDSGGVKDIADFGTGAGLPGIPLALIFPDTPFVLMDRMTKRVQFIESVKLALGLDNVTPLENQAEHYKTRHSIITFRAFRPFEYKLFKKIFRICEDGGCLVAYKGRHEKAAEEIKVLESLLESEEIIDLTVPFLDEERCLVLLKPIKRQAVD